MQNIRTITENGLMPVSGTRRDGFFKPLKTCRDVGIQIARPILLSCMVSMEWLALCSRSLATVISWSLECCPCIFEQVDNNQESIQENTIDTLDKESMEVPSYQAPILPRKNSIPEIESVLNTPCTRG